MGGWGAPAKGGSFWDGDESSEAGQTTTGSVNNDYVQVTTRTDSVGEDNKPVNPFNTFDRGEDPESYMQSYDKLKADIRQIEQNARSIKKLSERYNSSTGKEENQGMHHMHHLHHMNIYKFCRSTIFAKMR